MTAVARSDFHMVVETDTCSGCGALCRAVPVQRPFNPRWNCRCRLQQMHGLRFVCCGLCHRCAPPGAPPLRRNIPATGQHRRMEVAAYCIAGDAGTGFHRCRDHFSSAQNMKNFAMVATLVSLLGTRVCAHIDPDLEADQPITTVRAYLDTLERAGFSGAVLVEFHGNKVISEGYGYSDVLHGRRNSSQTVFDIGSVTKQFTAAAILKLEMEGRLSTDDKLSRFFKAVPGDKSEITIHHLLRHSSGLQSTIGGDYDSITAADFIDSVMRSPLIFTCGAAFSYSNIGYSLLAMIIERVSGVPYETFLYENLWRPAGMEQTGYRHPKFDEGLTAIGYHNDDRIWGRPTEKRWDADGPYWHLKGNGGILSTVEDLFRWNQALSTGKVLSEHAKTKMYHPRLKRRGRHWFILCLRLGRSQNREEHDTPLAQRCEWHIPCRFLPIR